MRREYRLYLKVGDEVFHKRERRWGAGVVVEERRSEVPGGFCYVRISFKDGKTRVFDNNFMSDSCCYYCGIRKLGEDEKQAISIQRSTFSYHFINPRSLGMPESMTASRSLYPGVRRNDARQAGLIHQ